MKSIISELKQKNPDLREAEIEGLLALLVQSRNLTNPELLRTSGIPIEVFRQFITSIKAFLEVGDSDSLSLNPEWAARLATAQNYNWSLPLNLGNLASAAEDLAQVRKKYGLSADSAKREYDQFFATPLSSVCKAALLQAKGLIGNNAIASIGDDDLLSVAIPSIEPTYKNITIFEIDERLNALLKTINTDMGISNVRIVSQDIRNELSKEYLNKYDVVFIDPPYTVAGLKLFIHRSIQLLKPFNNFSGSYIVLNFGESLRNPEKAIKVQEIINTFNLVIEDKISKFTKYHGAEIIGSSSSIYILKTTPFTSVDNDVLADQIYTFENVAEERFPYVDHFTAKAKNVHSSLVNSKTVLLKAFGTFCKMHKLNIVDTKITKFKNKGLSLTFILSTSNLLVHTWPEHNAIHIDLITCAPLYKKELLGQTLTDLLQTNSIEIRKVE